MKRVVFLHTQGSHAGLHQIIGTVEDTAYPPCLEGPFQVGSRQVAFASLIRITPHTVLYREVMKPTGRFGEPAPTFHPSQI